MEQHHIVYLEAANAPSPSFCFPHTCERYESTLPDLVGTRIREATIVVAGVTPITADHLDQAPYLQCLALTATGFEWLDRKAFAQRAITVVNCPQSNVEAVGEHFLALYFAARRKIVELHNAIVGSQRGWIREGSLTSRWAQGPPLSCRQEVLGIIGYGALGHKIEDLANAVGFGRVVIAERKGRATTRDGRVPFEEVVRTATTLAVCCPKEPSTLGLISEIELQAMKREALLVNLSRGGVVCENALAAALKAGRIFGASMDVLEREPGGRGTTPLIPVGANEADQVPNLTISAHVAWFSQKTMDNLSSMLRGSIEGFVQGTLLDNKSKDAVIVHNGIICK